MERPLYPFKKQALNKVQKKPVARTLRQLINAECQYHWPPGSVLYNQIEAPPSLRPGIKVSDISGLPTSLQDPATNLRYASADEYRVVKDLPPDAVKGYLLLRNAHSDTII
ncbi:INO80 complex subunit C [Echinococcus granulosus]|uniref:INO80 complex subunit C n=1 Tax=Echinococcus granulosus TaxID=6210 RepID=W6UVH6_ECHGR|nr:INO80 complex subunit C [Echinococcus granulosus]EUB64641.1 INO80 complex subunit C [Echinococcus granulosus]